MTLGQKIKEAMPKSASKVSPSHDYGDIHVGAMDREKLMADSSFDSINFDDMLYRTKDS